MRTESLPERDRLCSLTLSADSEGPAPLVEDLVAVVLLDSALVALTALFDSTVFDCVEGTFLLVLGIVTTCVLIATVK